MARKVIIDCDPGVEDAVALAIALFDPRLDVIAITGVTVIALPTGIFAASFTEAMEHRKEAANGDRSSGE